MKTFKSSTKHTAQVPHTVTKASDILAAICHREDTYNVIGDKRPGKDRPGYQVPITQNAMSAIIGGELGQDFQGAAKNPALMEYYNRVTDRLYSVGIELAVGRNFWYINKVGAGKFEDTYAYDVADLSRQGPAGFALSAQDAEGDAADPDQYRPMKG